MFQQDMIYKYSGIKQSQKDRMYKFEHLCKNYNLKDNLEVFITAKEKENSTKTSCF